MGEVLYYIDEYLDEVPVHGPSLADAAAFLHTGKGTWDTQFDAPLAQPGDIILLYTLTLLEDRTARRIDGAWVFDPPVPADCDFAAVRWGPHAGWDADTIFDPNGESAHDTLSCLADGEDDQIEDIAIGRNGSARARYDVIDDKPVLVLIADGVEVVAGG